MTVCLDNLDINKFFRSAVLKKIALFYFLTVVMLLPLLVSCSPLIKITYDDGKYMDKANDIIYYAAGVSYEPIAVGAEYAQYKKIVLHEIDGLDPAMWLTESYEGIGSIYYSSEITLPSLHEFEPSAFIICQVSETIQSLKVIEDQADVDAILDAVANGEDAELPLAAEPYHLKFTSDKYPGIYYDLLYVQTTDGKCYVFDRDTKRCVEIGDTVSKYFGGIV